MIITLIGPMASGKTTVGQILASKLKYPFVDTDRWIERETGLSVAEIFQTSGEASFREWETQALNALLNTQNQVLATGGGIVITPINRQLLQQALVVYLKVSPAVQLQRLNADNTRPLLHVSDKANRLTQLQQERDPWYQALAKITLNAEQKTPEALADEIFTNTKCL